MYNRQLCGLTAAGALLVPLFLLSCGGGTGKEGPRYVEIRRLIEKNLHFSAHLTWAVNADTIAALRREVTEVDIPVLVRLLGDEKSVVATGAALVLESFGEPAVPALEETAKTAKGKAAFRAEQALDNYRIRGKDGER